MLTKTLLFFSLLHLSALVEAQQSVQLLYKDYNINRSLKVDSSLIKMLQPYADSLNKRMNEVIGFSNGVMYKKQPESALGNLMVDCLKIYSERIFQTHVDAAILNYGGIRSYLPKGDIRLQTIYELVPFDNLIVLQKMNGNTLHQLLDLMANKGGWPLAGISMKIKNKTAVDILINDLLLNDTTVYTIAVSDYLANGGDGCSMLKSIAQLSKNYLYRDALIDYIKSFTIAGKPVFANNENRVVNVTE